MFLPSNITLKFGDSGDFVSELQRRLALAGCHADDNISGFYDGTTVTGVTRFQSMHGLNADGIAGPETLRRLNGIVSGDAGASSSGKKDEETQQAINTNYVAHQHIDAPDQMQFEQQAAMQQSNESRQATAPQATHMANEQIVREQREPVPPPSNDLAFMLSSLTGPQRQPSPEQQLAQQDQALQQQEQQQTQKQALQQEQPQPQQQQQGLVGKAIRFTTAFMQKLADYIESKLPSSVLREVQEIGQVMAQNGVREVPLPMGPEMRGPEVTPARGPEQIQQRG